MCNGLFHIFKEELTAFHQLQPVNAYLFAAACSFTLKADRGVKMTIKQKLNNQSCFCRQVFQ